MTGLSEMQPLPCKTFGNLREIFCNSELFKMLPEHCDHNDSLKLYKEKNQTGTF